MEFICRHDRVHETCGDGGLGVQGLPKQQERGGALQADIGGE
jgi:hypothetical protein